MISIAMATYNGEKYLREQLDSILVQTISDFELIICDDCSKDNTVSILKEYEQKDSRIKLYINEQNLGFRKNFEKAISLCSGEYIALCDQDDVWTKTHLEVLYKNIGDNSMCSADSLLIDGEGNSLNMQLSEGDNFFIRHTDSKNRLYRILFYQSPYQGSSSLYKKDLLGVALPIPEGINYHDAWFASCACMMNGINYVDSVISNYRMHGANCSGDHSEEKNKTFWMKAKNYFFQKFTTDRVVYCDELLKRFPNMNSELKSLIFECKKYLLRQQKKTGRMQNAIYRWKNYTKIMSSTNTKGRFVRCMASILRGF